MTPKLDIAVLSKIDEQIEERELRSDAIGYCTSTYLLGCGFCCRHIYSFTK